MSLSPRHGTSSRCGWIARPLRVQNSCDILVSWRGQPTRDVPIVSVGRGAKFNIRGEKKLVTKCYIGTRTNSLKMSSQCKMVTQSRHTWKVHVENVMFFRVPYSKGNFLNTWRTTTFSTRTLLHEVSTLASLLISQSAFLRDHVSLKQSSLCTLAYGAQ